jgi:hypothetical protein
LEFRGYEGCGVVLYHRELGGFVQHAPVAYEIASRNGQSRHAATFNGRGSRLATARRGGRLSEPRVARLRGSRSVNGAVARIQSLKMLRILLSCRTT